MSEEQITPNNGSYSADSIQVLEGLEAVRKRPAMYIGDISVKGLHHLVYEIVDNSIDEALAGYCDHIEVTINEDNSITVQDNGRGIPVDYHEKEKKSALEVAMTVLHAGGKFDKGSYKVSGGLHGVGMSCVNALSTHMTTQVFRNGKIYQQEYEIGKPLYSVKEVGTADITGTRQQFWPDGTIFTETVYDYKILASRLRELAYLNAGLRISLTDRRVSVTELPLNIDVLRRYSRQQRQEITSRLRKSARESSDQAFTRTARGLRTSIDDESALTWGPKVTAAKDMSLTPEEAEQRWREQMRIEAERRADNYAAAVAEYQKKKAEAALRQEQQKEATQKHGISEEMIANIGAQLRDCRIFVGDEVVRSVAGGARIRHGGSLLAADNGQLREVKVWRAGEKDKPTSEYMAVRDLITRWSKVVNRKKN